MKRGALLAIAYAATAVAVLAVRPLATAGPVARDFEAYWSAGSAWNAGSDPYAAALWNVERSVPGAGVARNELLPFVNPPATLPWWGLIARLPYSAAAALWLALLAASLVALVVLVLRASGAKPSFAVIAAALGLAIAFGPVTSDLALGQYALVALLGATGVVVAARRSPAVATLGAAVAFGAPNVSLGLVSQLGRNRPTLAMLLGAALTYVTGGFAAGWRWPFDYARAVLAHGDAERLSAIQLSPAAVVYGLSANPLAARAAGALVAVAAVVAAVALARRAHVPFVRFAGCSALIPMLGGFVHEHDLVVAFPAALWCALRTRGTTRALALAGTLLVAVDWLGLAQRPSGIAQSALLALAAIAAFIALGPRANIAGAKSLPAAALALAALFAIAAWIAAAHPAPVWPDAMRAFSPPAGAAAAEIWRSEQRASGLLVATPAWAFLRALSLAGCALLAYAICQPYPSGRTG